MKNKGRFLKNPTNKRKRLHIHTELQIMGFVVPILNRDFDEIRQEVRGRIKEEKWQRRLVLIIVSTALLLDNMLYMVIVPIIPDYLRRIGAYKVKYSYQLTNDTVGSENGTEYFVSKLHKIKEYESEDTSLGYLFASKAIIQLLVNPFSGALIDRIGYEIPMIIGLVIMFSSTAIFALGQSYGILFFARSLQGLGSAFADTSGLAMIANRFTEEAERSKALGIALAFISFGSLVAPPFGGVLYEFCGKPVPFLLLSFVCLLDGFMVFMVIHPKTQRAETGERIKGPTVFRLLLDPYIAVCAGALVTANVSLAFLEPTISKWMTDTMPTVTEWQIGLVWLPPFLPHVLGVYVAVKLLKRYSQISWLLAAVGLGLEGISCFIVPFATTYTGLIIPLSILCFGISLVDTALLPLLGYLVDTRHASVYGSVYAIADISYSIAYAIGPVVAGTVVANLGFFSLNLIICLSNVLYAPALSFIRSVYSYKPFENDFDGDYKRDVSFNESEFYGSLENQHFDPKQPGHQYAYDQVLPKPPVPELKATLEKYVKYAGVVADSKSQLFQTERFVEHFYRTEGPQLQKRLEEIADQSSNWINHFWLKTMYLENRVPLPLYSNPGYAFDDPNFHSDNKDDMFKYIALFIQGLFDFKAVVDRRELPSDYSTGMFGGSLMCMEQFWYLFSSYRHPRLGVDTLERVDTNTEHITIYIMTVMKDGKIIDRDNLAKQLATIKFMADKSITSNHWPVGFVTAVNRDKASLAYKILEKDPINRKSLEDIKRSAFVVCLDESLQSDKMMSKDHLASSSLSYMISTVNNRWFDKTFQFIFTEDGLCGVNYEHSVAEGMPMFKMVDHALNYIISKSLNIEILHYTGYGKQFIKSINASPDAIVQMALQWTFFKCHGKLTSTYETASLRRFKQGRVENLRSATPETLNWVKQMENENASMAVTGYGIDNHLWALKDISLQMCDIMPKIFSDAMFRELFTFRLSTSQIPWLPDNAAVGYGPVVDDGYGCAYKLSDGSIKFFISTLNTSDKTNIAEFHHTLKTTLDQFQIFLSSFQI
ncbi:Vesicular acetylcholine transporter unc-17 [Trichinella nativa]|uniref:Vesicular acetylcholine transporter unc-17 n=1 Tax=Trichinella nativa TaxID=6335 RepID=A0A0V1LP81_9BILA|nr:Vesicular acetylcholine transporter unc-17 [Trichinella nativa]